MEAAEYLYVLFSQDGASGLDRIPEVWAWLSAFYFEQLCPARKDGTRRPGEEARWIPIGTAFRYYRHLLAGPYLIYKSFRMTQSAQQLSSAVHWTRLEIFRRTIGGASRVRTNSNHGHGHDAVSRPKVGKPKRGASPTERKARQDVLWTL